MTEFDDTDVFTVLGQADVPTMIDAEELEQARGDEAWRDFCAHAEEYVLANTRTLAGAERGIQPA